jgi:hypothetical protein
MLAGRLARRRGGRVGGVVQRFSSATACAIDWRLLSMGNWPWAQVRSWTALVRLLVSRPYWPNALM